jgi:hypothetical protein
LFWDVFDQSLVVLDHNQAFDENFDPATFVDLHVFARQAAILRGDFLLQQHYSDRFAVAMAQLDEICDTCPPEWWFIDDELTMPISLDRNAIKGHLTRCTHEDFWKFL